MNICEAHRQPAGPSAGTAIEASERNSFELLMINPRLNNWKPETDGSGRNPNRPITRLRFLNQDRNGDHVHSIRDACAQVGGRAPLAAAGSWRLDWGGG